MSEQTRKNLLTSHVRNYEQFTQVEITRARNMKYERCGGHDGVLDKDYHLSRLHPDCTWHKHDKVSLPSPSPPAPPHPTYIVQLPTRLAAGESWRGAGRCSKSPRAPGARQVETSCTAASPKAAALPGSSWNTRCYDAH